MSTGAIVAIVVIAVLAVLALGYFLMRPRLHSQGLRKRFGPEYDHLVDQLGDRQAAERELAEREQRHHGLELKSLSPAARDQYTKDWTVVQEQFVDSPSEAVEAADRLLAALTAELGYPEEGHERRLADLSVRHSHRVAHYRSAHEIQTRGDGSTDDLRQALISYRTVFHGLIERESGTTSPAEAKADA